MPDRHLEKMFEESGNLRAGMHADWPLILVETEICMVSSRRVVVAGIFDGSGPMTTGQLGTFSDPKATGQEGRDQLFVAEFAKTQPAEFSRIQLRVDCFRPLV